MIHRDVVLRRNPSLALGSILEDFFSEGGFDNHWMRSDIQETDTAFQISIDLPGVKKDQVEVSLEDGRLYIEVKQEEKHESREDGKWIRVERHQQRAGRRVFQVGKAVDEESIQARMEDGVLHIELAKKEPERRKRLISLQ